MHLNIPQAAICFIFFLNHNNRFSISESIFGCVPNTKESNCSCQYVPYTVSCKQKSFFLFVILAVMLHKILRLRHELINKITGSNQRDLPWVDTHIPHNTRNYWFRFSGFALQDNNFKAPFDLCGSWQASTIICIFPAGKSRHKNIQSDLTNSHTSAEVRCGIPNCQWLYHLPTIHRVLGWHLCISCWLLGPSNDTNSCQCWFSK